MTTADEDAKALDEIELVALVDEITKAVNTSLGDALFVGMSSGMESCRIATYDGRYHMHFGLALGTDRDLDIINRELARRFPDHDIRVVRPQHAVVWRAFSFDVP